MASHLTGKQAATVKVVDWGDGASEDATASGTILTHQYAVDTAHTIRIKANCYRVTFGSPQYRDDLYDVNGNWDALGDITDGSYMFNGCANAILSFSTLPKNLVTGLRMFD